MLAIDMELLDLLYEEACKNYPKECCGLLLGEISEDGEHKVKMIRPVKNSAPLSMQKESFFITEETLMREEIFSDQTGMEIVGFYHSHPDEGAGISVKDQKYMVPNLSYLVLAVCGGHVKELKSYEKNFYEWEEWIFEEKVRVRKE